ncbi:Uncharacterised protein [Nocardiopsis dassonvillei]|nr:Uncharacterised protein [Nocardiopsis dassonvillei]
MVGTGARAARVRRAPPGGAAARGARARSGRGPRAPGSGRARPAAGRALPLPAEEGDYFQEASANCSWVSGLTLGGLTFAEKAMDGGELEMGSPGRMSMIWLFRSW